MKGLFSFQRKIKIEINSDLIHRLVWLLAGIVLVFVISIELGVFSHRKLDAGIEIRRAPFVILVHVVGLSGQVWNEMIGADRNGSVDGHLVPITPSEFTVFPVQVRAVSAGKEKSGSQRKVQGKDRFQAIGWTRIGRGEIAISKFQNYYSVPGIIQVESGNVSQLEQRFKIELNTRAD